MSWKNVLIQDVSFFQEGPGLRNWQWTDEGMKVINVKNILGDGAGSVDTSNSDKFISTTEFESRYKHFEVEEDDIVVASSGNTYGKVGRIGPNNLPLMMNTSVIRFRSLDIETLDNDYLYCFLRSSIFKNQVEQFVTGGAQPNFGPSHIKKMTIPLPPIGIQKSIGSIVSQYDQLITNNKQRIELLEESARQLYKEWFVRFRFPGHEHVKIIDGVPEGWMAGSVSDLGEVITGKTPSTKSDENFGSDIPFIKTPDMHGNTIIIKTEQYLTERGASTQANKLIPRNSILVSCIGTIGVTSINAAPAHTNQQINSVVPNRTEYTYFAFFALAALKTRMEAMGGGATMANVNKAKFSGLPVMIPFSGLIESFHEIVAPMFGQIETLATYSYKLSEARDLLLPKLMSGEIAV